MSRARREGRRSGYQGYDRNPYNPLVNFVDWQEWQNGHAAGAADALAEEERNSRLAARSAAQILDDEPVLQEATRDLLKRVCEKLEIE